MPTPQDYKRIPGRSERFEHRETGQVISRRQMENLKLQQQDSPFTSYADYQRMRKTSRFQMYTEALAELKGIPYKQAASIKSEFVALYAEAQKADWPTDATGPWARLLVAMGWRGEDDLWPVGDTPVLR